MALQTPEQGYLHDILEQPAALGATIRGLAALDLKTIPADVAAGKFQRIVLTGMGSSHLALYPLYYHLLEHDLNAILIDAAELVHYAPGLIDSQTLIVAVSQSGRSAEVVHLLDLAERDGSTVVGVTNTAGSPLEQRANLPVVTRAGEEATVSCKTYVSILLALRWLEDALLGRGLEAARAESEQVPGLVGAYLESWPDHVAILKKDLHGAQVVFLAGRGPSLAAAYAGGLVTKEAAHVNAEGMNSAALRHGPVDMVGPDTFVMVFAGEEKTRELNLRLANDLKAANARVAWIATDGEKAAYRLPPTPERLSPIFEILPVQMMTLALAELKGRTAGQFERACKVTIVE